MWVGTWTDWLLARTTIWEGLVQLAPEKDLLTNW